MNKPRDPESTHLVIIGGGSAAFAAAIEAHGLGARVTIINDGLPIGGTCVNVGCVPSKTLLRAAEANHRPNDDRFAGVQSSSHLTDFGEVIGQKRQLVEALRRAKYLDVIEPLENVELVEGHARFTAPRTVVVDEERIAADRMIVAAGASPARPTIEGLDEVDYLTNETAFELTELPESMVVLGANYIGLECAQLFSRFGTQVTVLELQPGILPAEAEDIAGQLRDHLIEEGIDVWTAAKTTHVEATAQGVALAVEYEGTTHRLEAERLLVATGRRPNTGDLGVDESGIILDEQGFVTVNSYLETTAEGVYGAGDVIGGPMFVYTAAYQGKMAARNALSDQPATAVDYHPLPWVVFTDPQVAGVGFDERQAREEGFEPQATTLPLSDVPRAIAARDTRGFIKLVRDRETDRLLGGRIVAPEGSELLMELAVAIKNEMTVAELVDMLHPYLTLSEGIRLAAMTFETSVDQLSCCAG
ncbi:MAG: mercury(II) reductase [Myxococcota bacterium]